MKKGIKPQLPNNDDRREFHVLGSDQEGRPIYDIHEKKVSDLPVGIEIEPAYRVRMNAPDPLKFEAIMSIAKATWEKASPVFLQPPTQPKELKCVLSPDQKAWAFEWKDTASSGPAKVTTFHLKPKLSKHVFQQELPDGWNSWEEYARAVEAIGIDPTVIQPPACDPVYETCPNC